MFSNRALWLTKLGVKIPPKPKPPIYSFADDEVLQEFWRRWNKIAKKKGVAPEILLRQTLESTRPEWFQKPPPPPTPSGPPPKGPKNIPNPAPSVVREAAPALEKMPWTRRLAGRAAMLAVPITAAGAGYLYLKNLSEAKKRAQWRKAVSQMAVPEEAAFAEEALPEYKTASFSYRDVGSHITKEALGPAAAIALQAAGALGTGALFTVGGEAVGKALKERERPNVMESPEIYSDAVRALRKNIPEGPLSLSEEDEILDRLAEHAERV